VFGASAGGVEALKRIAPALPADLAAAVLVVVHFPPDGLSVLPQILQRVGPLSASHAEDGEPLRAGHIFVAPPNRHLLVVPGHVQVRAGAKENGVRPAADPLFRTAARHYGRGVIGVVLSGNMNDGTLGLIAVHNAGGVTIVQDPAEALYPGMPTSAVEHARPDYVCRLDEIPPLLARLAREPIEGDPPMTTERDPLEAIVLESLAGLPDAVTEGTPPSSFTCPECHGALWETEEGQVVLFRCRVGHSFTIESLLAERTTEVESALWTALTALEERIHLGKRLLRRMNDRGNGVMASKYEESIQEARESATVLRQLLRVEPRPAAMGD
jgi:two-component system, chemotaxis family, protein-glutamate methylesterase/glutaminase